MVGSHPSKAAFTFRKLAWLLSCLWLAIGYYGSSSSRVFAQSADEILEQLGIAGSLLDLPPFDIITVTAEAGGKSVQVNLLDLPNRTLPTDPKPAERLSCVVSLFPDRTYEILWKDIAKITLWEQLLLERAKGLLAKKRFSESFEHLTYLLENYPALNGLNGLQQEFLFSSARDMATAGDFQHALSTLEQLHKQFPTFRSAEIRNAISGVASRLLEDLITKRQYSIARQLLDRLDSEYNGQISIVARYRDRLMQLATQLKGQANDHLSKQQFLEARRAATWMLDIAPDISGGRDLLLEIIRAYPIVRVGVLQKSKRSDVLAIGDWPASRLGKLTSTPLFSFRSAGPEGGVYQFAYGNARLSDDRLSIDITIQKSGSDRIPSALTLSQQILKRTDDSQETYIPALDSILKSVSVPTPERLTLNLRRPHVIPQALLQWSIQGEGESNFNRASYAMQSELDNSTLYAWSGEAAVADFQPRVIQEIGYATPSDAISSILRGELEIVDRLFPADARKLRGQTSIRVEPYALPTVHMLVPKSQDPFIQNTDFRRALLYGINRAALLNDEILGGPANDMDRLVSGPFPAGAGESDAISYAYDTTISPLLYDPRSAAVLISLAQANLQSTAVKRKLPQPKVPNIRLAVPNYEAAIVAGQAILQAWKVLGIDGTLSTYEHVSDVEEGSVDFLYLTAAVWEPVTDVDNLLGPGGPAETNNPYVVQSLNKLKSASNWPQVKEGCHELHAMVAAHLPILPLWQITEYFAYRTELQGVARKPVGLYQDIHRWRIQPQ